MKRMSDAALKRGFGLPATVTLRLVCAGSLLLSLISACTGQGTMNPAASAESAYTVGVYYYPWYGDDFHGKKYLREHLTPPQPPSLGEYDDRDAAVIAQHLQWSREANVSLWVASWWGPGRREDTTLRQHILPHAELGDMKIALFYETSGRIQGFSDLSNVSSDISYIAANYLDHPNYLRIDDRPVLFIYLTRVLSSRGVLAETVDLMRTAATEAGFEIYLVGDHAFGRPPSGSHGFEVLDGVTNYDVYGSVGAQGYAGQAAVDAYFASQAGWQALSQASATAFIPAATPGFNDKGVRGGHASVSRRLTADAEPGTLFRAMLRKAVTQTETSTGNMLLITSWNEWHEDTQIEPVHAAPATSLDDSDTGQAFSEGLEYEGYGERYLDILRQETTTD